MSGPAAIPRIKAAIWVDAEIRRCRANGIDAYLVRRGDEHAGAILIKHNRLAAGCTVYTPATAPDGGRAWRRGAGDDPLPEADADAYIARQRRVDPDLWVVEIEDPGGGWTLAEPVLP